MNKAKLKDFLLINFGLAIATFSFSFFLDPLNLVVGGTSGIGIILRNLTGYDSSFFILVLNIILLFLGLFILRKQFFIKTLYCSLVYPLFTFVFELLYNFLISRGLWFNIDEVETVVLALIASILCGTGLGIVCKSKATTGGTEVLQYMVCKFTNLPYGLALYCVDGLVILGGAFALKDPSLILYAVVFIYVEGIVEDGVIYNGFRQRTVHIISSKTDEIMNFILNSLSRGVSIHKIKGGYTNSEKDEIVCVLSTNEFTRLKAFIRNVDPSCFFYCVRASEVGGEGFTTNEQI